MIDKIIITNLPAFYKINLYNAIAQYEKLFVVFANSSSPDRNADFYSKEINFDYVTVDKGSKLGNVTKILLKVIRRGYRELILSGWDSPLMWLCAFFGVKGRNSLVIESSIFESITHGIKGSLKRIYLKRFSKVYVPGASHIRLIRNLGYSGTVIKTRGVGVFNIRKQPDFVSRSVVKKFLYVGRLSPEKNLTLLIETFGRLPSLSLSIVGFGPDEEKLRKAAKGNIKFFGAIPNRELYRVYQDHDVFILPSKSEPWGLVVEEALNNGLPVIVSNKVGCAEEIVIDGKNGFVFDLDKPDSLQETIEKVLDTGIYNSMRYYISKIDYIKIADDQVNAYLTK